MQRKYYIQELTKIRTLAKEFANDYPSLAPMLAEEATDPDVERLLEGFAFLTANVQERLDQQLPELSKSICNIFFPDCLAPTPSAVMMQFNPLSNAAAATHLTVDSKVASQAVDNVNCKFQLKADSIVEPIKLLNSSFKQIADGTHCLQADFTMLGVTLAKWNVNSLPFYITGPRSGAGDLFLCLMRYCSGIGITAEGGSEYKLPNDSLAAAYYDQQKHDRKHDKDKTKLNSTLTDYLVFPQVFFRPCLTGLSNWKNRGNVKKFSIRFYFSELPEWFTPNADVKLAINTFPAVNLFEHDSDPIHINYERAEYPIYVAGYEANQYAIHDVQSVESLRPHSSSNLHEYNSLEQELYKQNNVKHLYSIRYNYDELKNKVKFSISFSVTDMSQKIENETIVAKINMCNAGLTSRLLPGQIDQRCYGSPENISFANLHVPSKYYPANLDDMFRWRLISLLSYNYIADANLDMLKEVILLHANLLFGYNKDPLYQKLDAIENYQVTSSSLLYFDTVLPGYNIDFTCLLSGFISQGEIFVFGEMLALFLASSLPLNTFVRLSISIAETGERIEWPARTLDQVLL